MSSAFEDYQSLYTSGIIVFYAAISLLIQTFFYGIYFLLVPFSLYIMRQRRARAKNLVLCTIFMFTLSTAFWASSVIGFLVRLYAFFISESIPLAQAVYTWSALPNAIILLNYIITDAVVVWRAWVLCKDDHPKLLLLPMIALGFTTISVIGTIVIRVTLIALQVTGRTDNPDSLPLTGGINITQVGGFFMSLLTNILATSIISHKAWKHRQLIKHVLYDDPETTTTSKVQHILALLVESGLLYITSGITVLIAVLVRLPVVGTIGDIYMPINGQIVGIYPTIVLVIVSMQRSMDTTTFMPQGPSSVDLEFAVPAPRLNPTSSTATMSTMRSLSSSSSHRTMADGSTTDHNYVLNLPDGIIGKSLGVMTRFDLEHNKSQ